MSRPELRTLASDDLLVTAERSAPTASVMNAFVSPFLSSDPSRPALRVGVILCEGRLHRADADIATDLRDADFIAVPALLIVRQARRSSRPEPPPERLRLGWLARRLLRLVQAIDRRRVRMASAPTDPSSTSEIVAILGTDLVMGLDAERPPTAEEESIIEGLGLDVVIVLGDAVPRWIGRPLARHGTWSLRYGEPPAHRLELVGIREALDGGSTVDVGLVGWAHDGRPDRRISDATFATDRESLVRGTARMVDGSTPMVIQALHALHARHDIDGAEERVAAAGDPRQWDVAAREPGIRQLAAWSAANGARLIGTRTARRIGASSEERWRIGLRSQARALEPETGFDHAGFAWLDVPDGHACADPFLVEDGSDTWLFFEDVRPTHRGGVISCAQVDAEGAISSSRVVLETGSHLSYPCVFRYDADWFMIPESASSGSVDLYRASRFPDHWTREAVLFDAPALDTTILQHDGRWWFFTTLRERRSGAQAAMLYSAEELTGTWVPHPQNPISLDVRRARGAGAILQAAGRLIRPVQDGSRTYGYRIELREIVELSPTRLIERAVVHASPVWPGAVGTHTYARTERIEAVDAKFREARRPRWLGGT